MQRKGEKLGWAIGWIGGSLFLPVGGVLWLCSGNIPAGIIALTCWVVLVFLTLTFNPWRFPDTKYWKLLLPNYLCLFAGTAALLFVGFPGENVAGQWRNLLYLFPLLLPIATIGHRTWNDHINKR